MAIPGTESNFQSFTKWWTVLNRMMSLLDTTRHHQKLHNNMKRISHIFFIVMHLNILILRIWKFKSFPASLSKQKVLCRILR